MRDLPLLPECNPLDLSLFPDPTLLEVQPLASEEEEPHTSLPHPPDQPASLFSTLVIPDLPDFLPPDLPPLPLLLPPLPDLPLEGLSQWTRLEHPLLSHPPLPHQPWIKEEDELLKPSSKMARPVHELTQGQCHGHHRSSCRRSWRSRSTGSSPLNHYILCPQTHHPYWSGLGMSFCQRTT